MKNFCLILIIASVTSCNTSRLVNRNVDHKYHRAGFTYDTLQLNGYHLTYWDDHTNKAPLVLLHGFGTWAKFQWHPQIKELSKHYRLIIPNLLHFGRSNCDNCGYAINDQVKAMDLLISHLNLSSFNLAGASYGGVVAIELASTFPEKIIKLIIIDSPIKFFSEQQVKEVSDHFEASSIQEVLIPDQYQGMKSLISILYYKPPKVPTLLYKDIYNEMFAPYIANMHAMLNQLIEQQDYFNSKEYQLDFPILLIWGDEDKLVPKRIGQELHQYFGENSSIEIIPKTAHMPILEKPKQCNKLIEKFLLSK